MAKAIDENGLKYLYRHIKNHIDNISTTLSSAIDAKANKNSPSLTGTPTSPTAQDGTNTTQIATTEFVTTAVHNLEQSVASLNTVVDTIYPIGSIYMSSNSTSPSTLFPGTYWKRLKDQMLMGAGDVYTAGDTGGAASRSYTPAGTVDNHTLTASEMPSHTHTFTGSAVTSGIESQGHTHSVGAHAHGLNSHKHSVGAHAHGLNSHTHSVGAHAHGLNSHTHTGPSHTHTGPSHTHTGPSHNHLVRMSASSNPLSIKAGSGSYAQQTQVMKAGSTEITQASTIGGASGIAYLLTTDSGTGATGASGTGNTGAGGTGATGAASGNTANSTAFNSGAASGNTANSSAFDTGAASGSTADSTAFNSGGISADHTHSVTAAGTNSNTGGDGSHNHGFTGTAATIDTLPPYLVVYMWTRVATANEAA